MKEYIVTVHEDRFHHMLVEAETAEEAKKKAEKGLTKDEWDGDYLGYNDSSEWDVEEA